MSFDAKLSLSFVKCGVDKLYNIEHRHDWYLNAKILLRKMRENKPTKKKDTHIPPPKCSSGVSRPKTVRKKYYLSHLVLWVHMLTDCMGCSHSVCPIFGVCEGSMGL